MTKQLEIREGLKNIVLEVRQYLCNTEFAYAPFTESVDENVLLVEFPEKILKYLYSQNVAIKKEGELPKIPFKKPLWAGMDMVQWELKEKGYLRSQEDMLKVGYTLTEPLVEELSKETVESIDKGMEESKSGKVVNRGSFAKYVEGE